MASESRRQSRYASTAIPRVLPHTCPQYLGHSRLDIHASSHVWGQLSSDSGPELHASVNVRTASKVSTCYNKLRPQDRFGNTTNGRRAGRGAEPVPRDLATPILFHPRLRTGNTLLNFELKERHSVDPSLWWVVASWTPLSAAGGAKDRGPGGRGRGRTGRQTLPMPLQLFPESRGR